MHCIPSTIFFWHCFVSVLTVSLLEEVFDTEGIAEGGVPPEV